MPSLPLEIIFQIIDTVVESVPKVSLALPAKDGRAHQLRQWLLVSKATYAVTVRHVYTHCMCIASTSKLQLLMRTLNQDPMPSNQEACQPLKHLYISKLYLGLCTNTNNELPIAHLVHQLFCLIGPRLERLAIDFPPGKTGNLGQAYFAMNSMDHFHFDRACLQLTAIEEMSAWLPTLITSLFPLASSVSTGLDGSR